MIKSIFHININVKDFERSLAFYKNLGFKVVLNIGEGPNPANDVGLGIPNSVARAALLALGDDPRATRIDLIEWKQPQTEGAPYGLNALHPISGQPVPSWVANFVLMSYGPGAVMSVPAHDQRDFEFAQNYGLAIKQVIYPADGSVASVAEAAYTDKGVLKNSGAFDGLDFQAAFAVIAAHVEKEKRGQRRVNFRLRDWGVSRQRYWGCLIPAIHSAACGVVPVPEDHLPVTLPEDVSFDRPGNPLAHHPTWKRAKCPHCGADAERETDTLDTFVDSSWYFARFTDPNNEAAPFDKRLANYWLPVDQYVGGVEHAVLPACHRTHPRTWLRSTIR